MNRQTCGEQPANTLFELPCACQNLRRLTRVVTRIYDQELRTAGVEIAQFGLLTALAAVGEANQKRLSAGFAMDSTTLTRTLGLLRKQGWVRAMRGKDRRERLFSLTGAGKRQLAMARAHWERAERRLRKELGEAGWKNLREMVIRITEAGLRARLSATYGSIACRLLLTAAVYDNPNDNPSGPRRRFTDTCSE